MTNVLDHLEASGIAHRDLKLENILVDDDMNLKVADFGFATFKDIHKLRSYRGTKTYMAPEIKEGKQYDGRQVDVFSTGVILWIIVKGIFPFQEARKDDYYYKLILQGQLAQYWKKTSSEALSDEFKDLILKMLNYDPSQRPTVAELRGHPWMQVEIDESACRAHLKERV